MNRKEFLQSGAYTMLMASVARYSFTTNSDKMKNDFQLKIFATNWGYEGTLDAYCNKAKKEGYNGIEIWWPTEKKDQDELFAVLKQYDLEVGFLTAGHESAYKQHVESFKKMINAAAANKVQRPLYINCHSGKDFFSFEENKALVDHTIALSKETGIKICHETHRSRMLFAAPVAKHFFEKISDLRITFDVSHWCNVSESLLQDQAATVAMAIERTDHIHARIGHQEGPQVNDPRAPEWKEAVDAHFAWWDKIVELKRQKGEVLTVLTEFGPPTYLPTVPYTMQPLADQWAINVFMMQTFRKRYS